MNILFDHQAFAMQTHGGVSRSFAELYRHLPDDCKATVSLRESDNAYIGDLPGVRPKGYGYKHFICKKYFRGKGRLHVWTDRWRKVKYYPDYNRNYTVSIMQQGGFDVFHPTYFDDYFVPYLNGKPFVLTIHDMIPELYPQYFRRDDFQIRMKRRLAPLASAIIAVSENTKRDVVRLLQVPEEKVHVIYHGCSFPEVDGAKRLIDSPYILYVGDRFGYKDFKPFVRQVARFLSGHREVRVVCTGKPFRPEELQLMEACGCRNSFINHWVSTDEEFYALYRHALCFVYTSEYEGFGIPILEAYKAGCPVLLNNRSCFPEIAGEAAVYFELDDSGSTLCERLEDIASWPSARREALIVKQRERLQRYSWEKSARQLAEVYKSVAL